MIKSRGSFHCITKIFAISVCTLIFGVLPAWAQQPATEMTKVASQITGLTTAAADEHPLMPVLRWAEKERPNIEKIKDYTAIVTKQENVNGVVQEAQVMEAKIRHQPFSVYLKFRYPRKLNGQEAIYVRGQNDDKLIGHGVGVERTFGTQKIPPDGFIAMRGNKYPITDMGILTLLDRLLEVGYKDSKYGECDVKYHDNVKVNGRECLMIQVVHPVPRSNFMFYIARIFVDKELQMPIRYESYDWPQKEGEAPILIEAYTYQKLELNVGLTDADFDYQNPAYNYP